MTTGHPVDTEGRAPLISVVLATHNYAHFLPQAIRSIQAQTFSDWECIIVDDLSTDNTSEVVAELMRADGRIRYIQNTQNLGEAGSRNAGNRVARGGFIASLDADDWWQPDKLQMQIEALQRIPGAVLSFSAVTTVNGEQCQVYCPDDDWLDNLEFGLRMRCEITHSSVLVSRQAFLAVGGYDESLPFAVDWDLWLRLLDAFGAKSLIYLSEPLVNYRWHTSNMSHNIHRNMRGERKVVGRTLLRRAWGLRHPIILWQIIGYQIEREMARYERAGQKRHAALWACGRACLSPLRPWRWRRIAQILSAMAQL